MIDTEQVCTAGLFSKQVQVKLQINFRHVYRKRNDEFGVYSINIGAKSSYYENREYTRLNAPTCLKINQI